MAEKTARVDTNQKSECECGTMVYVSECFCAGCGTPNPHFSAQAFRQDWGSNVATMRRNNCSKMHRDAKRNKDTNFCMLCGTNLRAK